MPSEPFSGTHGTIPALYTSTSRSRSAGVIAELPRESDTTRESMMARTVVSSRYAPTLVATALIRFSWRRRAWATGTRWSTKPPMLVLTP